MNYRSLVWYWEHHAISEVTQLSPHVIFQDCLISPHTHYSDPFKLWEGCAYTTLFLSVLLSSTALLDCTSFVPLLKTHLLIVYSVLLMWKPLLLRLQSTTSRQLSELGAKWRTPLLSRDSLPIPNLTWKMSLGTGAWDNLEDDPAWVGIRSCF